MESSIKVLFFGQSRHCVGRGDFRLTVEQPIREVEFWRRLLAEFPALEALRTSARLARGEAYLTEGELLRPGDEVAVIPPVSGG